MENPYRPPGSDFEDHRSIPPGLARPTVLTVLGIFNIVLGSLALLCTPTILVSSYAQRNMAGRINDPVIQLTLNPSYQKALQVIGIPGMFLSAVEIIAGIGLLKMKSWGRTFSLGYAAAAILYMVAGMIIGSIYIITPLLKVVQENKDPEGTGRAIGGIIGGVIGYPLGAIYPISLLILLTRPWIVEAFRRRETYDPFEPEPTTFS